MFAYSIVNPLTYQVKSKNELNLFLQNSHKLSS